MTSRLEGLGHEDSPEEYSLKQRWGLVTLTGTLNGCVHGKQYLITIRIASTGITLSNIMRSKKALTRKLVRLECFSSRRRQHPSHQQYS